MVLVRLLLVFVVWYGDLTLELVDEDAIVLTTNFVGDGGGAD